MNPRMYHATGQCGPYCVVCTAMSGADERDALPAGYPVTIRGTWTGPPANLQNLPRRETRGYWGRRYRK